MTTAPPGMAPEPVDAPVAVTFAEAFRLWLKIGLMSFGGPAGQIALMHRLLVDERKWISENRFLHALNYCMLLPGPEAQQLAIYIGWLLHKTAGGLVAGILFVLPGALVMWFLSVLYAGFQDITVVQALFFGIKAAVLAVVIEALHRIGKRALKNAIMFCLAAVAFVAIFIFDIPFPIIVVTAGIAGFVGGRLNPERFVVIKGHDDSKDGRKPELAVVDAAFQAGGLEHTRPSAARALRIGLLWLSLWGAPLLLLVVTVGSGHVFTQESVFFSKMAVVTFGGAYAVLAYVAQQAVGVYGWLQPGEMLDGLGLAETTPGPLIMVVQFVGFLAAFRNPGALDPMVAGTLGAILTTWVTFVPCFLWIFLGAPYIEHLRNNKALSAALSAITAAVVGVVLNLAVWFALHVLFAQVDEVRTWGLKLQVPAISSLDPIAASLALIAIIAMMRFKVNMLLVLSGCALAGAAAYYIRIG